MNPEDMTPGEYNDAVREALLHLDGTEESLHAYVEAYAADVIKRLREPYKGLQGFGDDPEPTPS